ncbi:MAG: acetylglutamate kinase [Culicoidibacterales bacterium]
MHRNIANSTKAEILHQAFPYIENYRGKTVVIKYGGNAMQSPETIASIMKDVVLLSQVGIKIVLVHGGGPDISQTLTQMQLESHFVDGLRYTDKQTLEVAQMVLAGKNNKNLVNHINLVGGLAVGICGIDGKLIEAHKIKGKTDYGYVGEITKINQTVIEHLLAGGFIPVIAPLGTDELGNVYNINADTAASSIAAKLGAENLIMMTDIPGILRDKNDDTSLISQIQVSEVGALIQEGVVSGGMLPKIDSCVHAIREGVAKACIIDGRIPHAILIEMMTVEGVGTLFY